MKIFSKCTLEIPKGNFLSKFRKRPESFLWIFFSILTPSPLDDGTGWGGGIQEGGGWGHAHETHRKCDSAKPVATKPVQPNGGNPRPFPGCRAPTPGIEGPGGQGGGRSVEFDIRCRTRSHPWAPLPIQPPPSFPNTVLTNPHPEEGGGSWHGQDGLVGPHSSVL